jgi:transcription initiation factor TFIID subunit 1
MAAKKIPPTTDILRNFHRPRATFPANRLMPIVTKKETTKRLVEIIRKKKDLSLKDGRFVMVEYVEEFPPMLANPGMGARIHNYYRLRGPSSLLFQPFSVLIIFFSNPFLC